MILNSNCLGFFVILMSLSELAFSSDYCPIDRVKIDSLNQLFKKISPVDQQTVIEYDSLKTTLLFKIHNDKQLLKSYKVLITDIHPEGIFYIEQSGALFFKIISKCSGNVFIKTDHKGSFLLSKTTNRLILGEYSMNEKHNISTLCRLFQSIVFDCQLKNDDEEDILLPFIKKN